jgi:ubiquinone/menaquinone biosynthesis C-methylase UbiE
MNWHERYTRQASWTRELRSYLFDKTRLRDARRVLEVGCGTGAILSALPNANQRGSDKFDRHGPRIHGLDLDAAALRECCEHETAAYLTRGDALSLPYPAGLFDIAYCHFLLLWVAQPLQALHEMKRVTAHPGYVLALAEPDYAARQDEPAELAWLGRRQNQALQEQGAALSRGAQLAELFYQAGIEIIETGVIRQAAVRALTPEEWESEWKTLEDDLHGAFAPVEMARMKELDRAALRQGERVLHVPTYFAWGQV